MIPSADLHISKERLSEYLNNGLSPDGELPWQQSITEHLEHCPACCQLLAELSDEDLASKIPGAPWADGTVGAIMAANADHGRMHFAWAEEDPVSAATKS